MWPQKKLMISNFIKPELADRVYRLRNDWHTVIKSRLGRSRMNTVLIHHIWWWLPMAWTSLPPRRRRRGRGNWWWCGEVLMWLLLPWCGNAGWNDNYPQCFIKSLCWCELAARRLSVHKTVIFTHHLKLLSKRGVTAAWRPFSPERGKTLRIAWFVFQQAGQVSGCSWGVEMQCIKKKVLYERVKRIQ